MSLMSEHFKAAMVTVVFVGTDQKMHIQVAQHAANKEQALDLARRGLQEVERAETGVISTLSPNEKRIIE